MSRLKELVRRQLVDAIFERGMVEGLRIEVNPGKAALVPFQELMPRAGQVLVETRYSAISCGTERAYYLRLNNVVEPYPIVMGYSMVGEVVATGPECSWALGRVVACPGPHASLHLSPAERTLPVPSDVPLPHAALFNMGVIAQQGVRRARILPGESVVVLGAGLIGQLAAQLAVLAGAEVTIVATSQARLSVARACGIERTIDATSGLDKLKTVAATVVIDATGRPDAVKQAVLVAADGARVILLGSSRGTTTDIGAAAWAKREVSLRGAHLLTMPQGAAGSGLWTWEREARTFLEFSRKRLRLEPLITRQLPPNDVSTLYQALAAAGVAVAIVNPRQPRDSIHETPGDAQRP
jgi:2-desacetyl-2-hydroxyethyl bacteriochlorophyllide A dehydrogenase